MYLEILKDTPIAYSGEFKKVAERTATANGRLTIVCVALNTETKREFNKILLERFGSTDEDCILLETGMGNLSSFSRLERVLRKLYEASETGVSFMDHEHFDIVNIGTCLAVNPNVSYSIGKIVKPSTCKCMLYKLGNWDVPVYELNGRKGEDFPELLSTDFFVQKSMVEHNRELSRADIIDMECYGLCKAATHWLAGFQGAMRVYKVVSDRGEQGVKEWQFDVLRNETVQNSLIQIVGELL